MDKVTAVILAAGQGTRMRSDLPKVLHPLAGKPLIQHALSSAALATTEKPVVVIGHGAEAVREAVGDGARFAIQDRQLGTANALQAAEPLLADEDGLVLVFYADMPLYLPETIKGLVQAQQANTGPMSMLTMVLEVSHGFGRILRGPDGAVREVVEEAQATPEQLAIHELNVGAYCFDSRWLWPALRRIGLSPKGEYYLTDIVGIASGDGLPVQALAVSAPEEAIGINNRAHLAEAEAILRRRLNATWMLSGVTMIDPDTTYIEPGVVIGRDTTLWPNTHLRGKCRIGEGCEIGPNSILQNAHLGNHCKVISSIIEDTDLVEGTEVGPFEHLRGEGA